MQPRSRRTKHEQTWHCSNPPFATSESFTQTTLLEKSVARGLSGKGLEPDILYERPSARSVYTASLLPVPSDQRADKAGAACPQIGGCASPRPTEACDHFQPGAPRSCCVPYPGIE